MKIRHLIGILALLTGMAAGQSQFSGGGGGGGGGGPTTVALNAILNPSGNTAISTTTFTTTFTEGDFGASPVASIFGITDNATSTTDTSYDFTVVVPAGSFHQGVNFSVDGFNQFEVCNVGTNHDGEIFIGNFQAHPTTSCLFASTSPLNKLTVLNNSNNRTEIALVHTNVTGGTGNAMLRMLSATSSTGLLFWQACAGTTNLDGVCNGTVISTLDDTGNFVLGGTGGTQISGTAQGSTTVSVPATYTWSLFLGSDNVMRCQLTSLVLCFTPASMGFTLSGTATVLATSSSSGATTLGDIATYNATGDIGDSGTGIFGLPLACADTSASGTAQTCTTTPNFTPVANQCVIYTTTTTNTSSSLTVAIDSLTAKPVAKWQGNTTLLAGDVQANVPVVLCYDGTNWELSNVGVPPITATAGLTTGIIPQSNATRNLINSSPQLDNGVTNANGLTYAGTAGFFATAGPLSSGLPSGGVGSSLFLQQEGSAPSGLSATAQDDCYADSTKHRLICSFNAGSNFPLGIIIAEGTAAMGTGGITSGTCASAVTVSASGVATTDTIIATPNADPTGVTGYAVSASGSLYIQAYPTANNVNFKVCNNTAGTLTPAALTLNFTVVR